MKDNELKIMIEYYNQGLNDREISELMNVTQNKIYFFILHKFLTLSQKYTFF